MFVVESLENERHSFPVGTNAGSVLYQPLILNFLFYFLLVQRFRLTTSRQPSPVPSVWSETPMGSVPGKNESP